MFQWLVVGGVVVVHIDDVGRLCLGAVRVNIVAKSKVNTIKEGYNRGVFSNK